MAGAQKTEDGLERFEAMDEASLEKEACRARRRILGELLRTERIADSSTSQLQGTLKVIEEAFPAVLDDAGRAGGATPGQEDAGAAVADWPGADGIRPFCMDSLLIADGFAALRRDVLEHRHTEYVLPGGRGSTKSSFVSLMLAELLLRNPTLHVLCVRQIAATLRDSVYAQMRWAIEALGVGDAFAFVPGKLFIERKATGQRIYLRGADDPTKIKSLKPPFGAVGAVWFEEFDQFAGEAEVRNIEQSALRGFAGGGWIFKSFNPPRVKRHWANRYAAHARRGMRVFQSDYRSAAVPQAWLGQAFLERAADLESRDYKAFEHEYLGVANLSGGMVFQNVVCREVTDEEIAGFAHIYNGADWGWYPDPWAFNRVAWLPAQRTIVIFCERQAKQLPNRETAAIMLEEIGTEDPVVCDSSEPKSIADWRAAGVMAQPAIKGAASRGYSIKWLQGLNAIIIDGERCPKTLQEFGDCCYRILPGGEVSGEIAARDDHHIDAVRYAMERVWKRRGT